MREAVSLLQPLAEEHGVELRCLLEDVGEAHWDKKGIHRVLLNLGTNAIDACRFHPDRARSFHVEFRLGLDKASSGQRRVLLEVWDNGCGMDREVRERVFSRFFSTKGGQGTGLGLLLTRKIVQEHGGEISFESREGQGTTFRVLLPRGESQPGGLAALP